MLYGTFSLDWTSIIWMDDGFVDVSSGTNAASDFIETCGELRFWDRESVKQD